MTVTRVMIVPIPIARTQRGTLGASKRLLRRTGGRTGSVFGFWRPNPVGALRASASGTIAIDTCTLPRVSPGKFSCDIVNLKRGRESGGNAHWV